MTKNKDWALKKPSRKLYLYEINLKILVNGGRQNKRNPCSI